MADQAQLDTFFDELRRLVEQHIQPEYKWYQGHTTLPWICFRTAGVVVVIGSLMLPVIAAHGSWPYSKPMLTAVSLAVAVLSSLSTFFRWDATWRSRTNTAGGLKGFLAKWELSMTMAQTNQNPREAALAATQKLFDETFSLVGSETEGFFATVKWPEISKER
jgi:hypothetical protein